jgi:transcriptional regulator with XRE-family HTH domain
MQTNPRDNAPFDRELFQELCVEAGLQTDAERARALGVHQSTILRNQSGDASPSLQFALACRRVFGLEAFAQLFPIPKEAAADERVNA